MRDLASINLESLEGTNKNIYLHVHMLCSKSPQSSLLGSLLFVMKGSPIESTQSDCSPQQILLNH